VVSALHPSRPPGGRSSLAGIGVVSIVVFWTGLPVMLAAGGAAPGPGRPPRPWPPARHRIAALLLATLITGSTVWLAQG
jgi:hypothetical protein